MLRDVITDPIQIAEYAIQEHLGEILLAVSIAAIAAVVIVVLAVRAKKRIKEK